MAGPLTRAILAMRVWAASAVCDRDGGLHVRFALVWACTGHCRVVHRARVAGPGGGGDDATGPRHRACYRLPPEERARAFGLSGTISSLGVGGRTHCSEMRRFLRTYWRWMAAGVFRQHSAWRRRRTPRTAKRSNNDPVSRRCDAGLYGDRTVRWPSSRCPDRNWGGAVGCGDSEPSGCHPFDGF